MPDEIEYYYVRGKGWLAGYKGNRPIELMELQNALSNLVLNPRQYVQYRVRYPITRIRITGVVEI